LPSATVDDVWFELGGSASPQDYGEGFTHGQTPINSSKMALARGPNDTFLAAWTQDLLVPYPEFYTYEIYARLWNGESWEDLGPSSSSGRGVSNTAFPSFNPSATFDSEGRPVIAWLDRTLEQGRLYAVLVSRWNGVEWERLGGPIAVTPDFRGQVTSPDVAAESDGELFVTWAELATSHFQIYAMQWDGDDWVEVGAGSASGNGVSATSANSVQPSIVVDPAGRPVIAWREDKPTIANGTTIYARRFENGQWLPVTPNSASGDMGVIPDQDTGRSHFSPQLAVSEDGTLALSCDWSDASSRPGLVHLQSGDEWIQLDGPFGAEAPFIAFDDQGTLTALDRIHGNPDFLRWNGTEWLSAFSGDPPLCILGSFLPMASALGSDGLPRLIGTSNNGPGFSGRLVGEEWEPLGGGSSLIAGISSAPTPILGTDVAVRDNLLPIVAWVQSGKVFVRMWGGETWTDLAPNSPVDDITGRRDANGELQIAADSIGNPGVVWTGGLSKSIFFRQWNGVIWLPLGGTVGSSAAHPTFAYGALDRPIAAWSTTVDADTRVIFLRGWTGGNWSPLAGSALGFGISMNSGFADFPSIATDADGNPIVAWQVQDGAEPTQIHIRRFDGTSWVEIGLGSANLGGISATEVDSVRPSLAIGADGNPIVAWEERQTPSQVFVRRWDGSAWIEVGQGSATGGGISGSAGDSLTPKLAVDGEGTPTIAWSERTTTLEGVLNEIHVRRFNGVAWVEVGDGSAAGGGISRSDGQSTLPALTVSSSGVLHAAWAYRDFALFCKSTDRVTLLERDGRVVADNFPETLGVGLAVNTSIRAFNSGLETWEVNSGITLRSPDGEDPLFPAGLFVPAPFPGQSSLIDVLTGESGRFLARLEIPSSFTPRTHTTRWRLHDPEAGFFGAEFQHQIVITGRRRPGSANGDAFVDVLDVVALTNHLNGGAQIVDSQAFDNADLTQDGALDQDDLNALVDLVIGR
jgi:hypothetical protein